MAKRHRGSVSGSFIEPHTSPPPPSPPSPPSPPPPPPPGLRATSCILEGPESGVLGIASLDFTVTPENGWYVGTITPQSTGTGTFAPTSLTWSGTPSSQEFSYTAESSTDSPHLITLLSNPALDTRLVEVFYFVKVTGPVTIDSTPRNSWDVHSPGEQSQWQHPQYELRERYINTIDPLPVMNFIQLEEALPDSYDLPLGEVPVEEETFSE